MLKRIALFSFNATCMLSNAALANTYSIVDIGVGASPVAINNNSDIVGNEGNRARIYRDGRWHNLSPQSHVSGLNDAGDSVGYLFRESTAASWKLKGAERTVPVPKKGRNGRAAAINAELSTVGWFNPAGTSHNHCFLWQPHNKSIDIGMLETGGECQPTAINDGGQVTGAATLNFAYHPFIWQNGAFDDLGILQTWVGARGAAINESGQVVGAADVGGSNTHAFLWDGNLIDLHPTSGYASSSAASVNNSLTIVGSALQTQSTLTSAVRFANAQVIPLASEVTNLGDWQLVSAVGVNESGVIVGVGIHTTTGETHAFELIPN